MSRTFARSIPLAGLAGLAASMPAGCETQGLCIQGDAVQDVAVVPGGICQDHCEPYGTCVLLDQEPRCLCAPGYHEQGLDCVANSPADPCQGNDCSKRGTCEVVDTARGITRCACQTGFRALGGFCLPSVTPRKGVPQDLGDGKIILLMDDDPAAASSGLTLEEEVPRIDALPSRVDHRADYLRAFCPTTSDQGECGWCVAHATTHLIEALQCAQRRPEILVSEPHLWHVGGKDIEDCEGGWWNGEAVAAAAANALLDLARWPYDTGNMGFMPSAEVLQSGTIRATRPRGVSANSVDDLKAVLAAGFNVAIAVPVFGKMEGEDCRMAAYWRTNGGGFVGLPGPDETRCGGHAILLVGYDDQDSGGVFWFRNSWGRHWPAANGNGYARLTYGFIARHGYNGAYLASLETGTCGALPRPVLDLPLEGGMGGVYEDASGSGNPAQGVGDLEDTQGIVGRAAESQDGSAFLKIGGPGALAQGDSRTVSLWFKAGSSPRRGVLFHQADMLDLDRDGRLDVVLANNYADATGQKTDSFVYYNHPEGFAPEPFRIPTNAASGIASADLDGNGWLDLVIAHDFAGLPDSRKTNLYRGTASGLVPDASGALNPAGGGVAIADLDGDGWMDLVFGSSAEDDGGAARVFLGAESGFDRQRSRALPAGMPRGLSVADLNRDGLPDVVVSNLAGDVSNPGESFAFLNGAAGLDASSPIRFPTDSSYGNAVADLDQDGFPDVVFGSYWDMARTEDYTDDRYDVSSWIYRGTKTGFDLDGRLGLPSFGGLDANVADLDGDGWPDLLMANFYDGTKDNTGAPVQPLDVPSRIYWGSADGFHEADRTELAANACHGMPVADLNGDGWLDVVVPSSWNGTTHDVYTRVFWGGSSGYRSTRATAFPSSGTVAAAIPGSPVCASGTVFGTQPCRYGSVLLAVQDGRLVLELHDGSARASTLSAAFTPGRWTHVTATYDASAGRIRMYLDGQPAGSLDKAFTMGGTFPWRVRLFSDVENLDRFTGAIDEVKVFDRALTADEVACLASPAAGR